MDTSPEASQVALILKTPKVPSVVVDLGAGNRAVLDLGGIPLK
jgi:hypothetical protein